MPVKLVYFAWVRERVGKTEEIWTRPRTSRPSPTSCAG